MVFEQLFRPRLWLLGLLLAGCSADKGPVEVAARPRPVTVFELQRTQPVPGSRYAGSVSAWKSQDVGFEVSGRVQRIVEPGQDVVGPQIDLETGAPTNGTGSVLARISPTRYEVRLASAQASVQTARARLSAAEQEVKNVVPKQLLASAANLELAKQEFSRIRTLVGQDAATQQALDRAQANLDSSQAEYQQLEAVAAVKEAERASYAAQVDEALEAVRQAKEDLDDTVLLSPFQGQVSAVYETVGSVVQSGQPVLRVQMMDPIQVEVQVSAETDARLLFNDLVRVYPPGEGVPVPAMVYEKAALADTATRTFLVSLLIRNSKLTEGLPADVDRAIGLRTRSLAPLFSEAADDGPPYYVRDSAVLRDGDEYFVWRTKVLRKGHSESQVPSPVQVERVRVVPGDKRITFLSVVALRELKDLGELEPESDLIVADFQAIDGAELDASQVVKRLTEQGQVYYVRERWRFRPGDVVQAELTPAPVPRGYYVPMNAVVREDDKGNLGSLFLVEGEAGSRVTRKVAIRLTGVTVGTLVQIEPIEPEELPAGARVVASGVHFLAAGEAVRIVNSGESQE